VLCCAVPDLILLVCVGCVGGEGLLGLSACVDVTMQYDWVSRTCGVLCLLCVSDGPLSVWGKLSALWLWVVCCWGVGVVCVVCCMVE